MNRIVVISGHFFILHPGVFEYIKIAKKYGDYLVVIVNNDQQVLNKKGFIVFDEEARAKMVSDIYGVNAVYIAIDRDSSVAETLKVIKPKPHIFLNSGDRNISNANPKEKYVCDMMGIEMIYDSSPKIDSSTNVIERIRCEY